MNFSEAQIISWVSGMLLPFFRITSLLMTMPLIGTKMVPGPIKIMLAIAITLLIYPTIKGIPDVSLLDPKFIVLVAQQVLVGIAMGFLFQLTFQVLIMAGALISMQSGLAFSSLVDPATQTSMPAIAHFYVVMGSLLFITLNGHLLALQLVAQTFDSFPISTALISHEGFGLLLKTSGMIFLNGVLISLPAIIALLLTNISLAIITRAAPQLNIFTIGFPITLMAGIFMLLLSLTELSREFYVLLEHMMETVTKIFM